MEILDVGFSRVLARRLRRRSGTDISMRKYSIDFMDKVYMESLPMVLWNDLSL